MDKTITKLQSVDLEAMAARVFENAKKHGFHDESRSISHWLCLFICELSEAVEADRHNKRALPEAFDRAMKEPVSPHEAATPEEIYDYWFETYIKDSLEDELADAAIRLLDLAGDHKSKLNTAFREHPNEFACDFKQGWSFTEQIFHIESIVTLKVVCLPEVFFMICSLAEILGFDLFEYIEKKMTYNEHRPFKHGKEY